MKDFRQTNCSVFSFSMPIHSCRTGKMIKMQFAATLFSAFCLMKSSITSCQQPNQVSDTSCPSRHSDRKKHWIRKMQGFFLLGHVASGNIMVTIILALVIYQKCALFANFLCIGNTAVPMPWSHWNKNEWGDNVFCCSANVGLTMALISCLEVVQVHSTLVAG